MQSPGGSFRYIWLWLIVCSPIIALLAVRLHNTANPWALVQTIPNGELDQGVGYCHDVWRHWWQRIDLSPDERHLATARPDGTVEVWDMATLTRVITLGQPKPKPEQPDEYNPDRNGAHYVGWASDGRSIVVMDRDRGYTAWDIDGNRVPLPPQTQEPWVAATSPGLDMAGFVDVRDEQLSVCRLGQTSWLWHCQDDAVRWQPSRVQWSSDGRSMLAYYRTRLLVLDAATGQQRFSHPDLDVRLPLPMFADEWSGFGSKRHKVTWTTTITNDQGEQETCEVRVWPDFFQGELFDSQFSPDASVIASIYSSYSYCSPAVHRVRLYGAASGALLLDHEVGHLIRSIAFSPDSARLCIVAAPQTGVHDIRLLLFDVRKRELVHDFYVEPGPPFAQRATWTPDNRFVVTHGSGIWLVDVAQRAVPVNVFRNVNVGRLIITSDGNTIVGTGTSRAVPIWRKRRDPSPLGTYALPETWGIFGVAFVMVFGFLAHAAATRRRQPDQSLPKGVWPAMCFCGMLIVGHIGWRTVSYVAAYLYGDGWFRLYWGHDSLTSPLVTEGFAWGTTLVAMLSAAGLVRLNDFGRRVLTLLTVAGLIAICGITIWVAGLDTASVIMIPPEFTGGWRLACQPWHVYAALGVSFLALSVQLVLLNTRRLRDLCGSHQFWEFVNEGPPVK